MSDRSLLQRVGGTHIGHQVTGGKYTADIASSDPAAVRTQHVGPLLNAFRRQWDVIGDHHIIRATSLGNPHVGGVGTVIHDDKTDQRMGMGPDATIADHHRPAVVTNGNGYDLMLYRTGICVDIDRHSAPTINQPGPHCTRRDGQAYPRNGMPADYERDTHLSHAVAAGLSREVIDSLSHDEMPDFVHEDEELVYLFSRELNQTRSVSDGLFERTLAFLGRDATVDLVGVLGYYSLISMTIKAFAVPPASS